MAFLQRGRKSIRRISVMAVMLLFPCVLFSQRTVRPSVAERMFFGGNFGLQFGTITDIEVAPIVGLWILPRLSVACGPEYIYYNSKYTDYECHIAGGKVYTQFMFLQDLNNLIPIGLHIGAYAHLEDEILKFISTSDNDNITMNTLLLGGGLSFPLGKRASLNLMALWALTNSDFSYYDSPIIRFSFNF